MIHVHPVSNGFGYTYVTERADGSLYAALRQGTDLQPWSQAEATNRANTVGDACGHHVVQNDAPPVFEFVLSTGKAPNVCDLCSKVIPHTGGRGRPRKQHVECQQQRALDKAEAKALNRAALPKTGVAMLDEAAATMEFEEVPSDDGPYFVTPEGALTIYDDAENTPEMEV